MSTNIPSAKTLSGSWDALSDADAFVAVVSTELAAMKADGTLSPKWSPRAPQQAGLFSSLILITHRHAGLERMIAVAEAAGC